MFQSTKLFEGFSCCFRQWKATQSHCQYLHSYVTKIEVTFEGELDDKNWIQDFGSFKKNGIKAELERWFDHTTLVAGNDPELKWFEEAAKKGLIQLRILPNMGAERYAEFVFHLINRIVLKESEGRVRVCEVKFFENNTNSAIYKS